MIERRLAFAGTKGRGFSSTVRTDTSSRLQSTLLSPSRVLAARSMIEQLRHERQAMGSTEKLGIFDSTVKVKDILSPPPPDSSPRVPDVRYSEHFVNELKRRYEERIEDLNVELRTIKRDLEESRFEMERRIEAEKSRREARLRAHEEELEWAKESTLALREEMARENLEDIRLLQSKLRSNEEMLAFYRRNETTLRSEIESVRTLMAETTEGLTATISKLDTENIRLKSEKVEEVRRVRESAAAEKEALRTTYERAMEQYQRELKEQHHRHALEIQQKEEAILLLGSRLDEARRAATLKEESLTRELDRLQSSNAKYKATMSHFLRDNDHLNVVLNETRRKLTSLRSEIKEKTENEPRGSRILVERENFNNSRVSKSSKLRR
eukprot:TRINITY_DN8635_c0_g3_i2.p1 TRINITY_DN8635_c0_g3~~TRINITY_DN8635_c0_g3_i2.p1  ORF type:complete len:383 (-),score=69.58 TRINITY_DN8635_c0_g3_i2:102-1250(-)